MTPSRLMSLLAAALLAAAAGCDGPEPCVVSGRVLVDDLPAEGVYLVFRTAGDPSGLPDSGSARSVEGGSFTAVVSTPGEATVTAFWPTVTVKDQDVIEGPDRLLGVYRDPRNPAASLTVRRGANETPPIQLATPSRGRSRTSPRR